LENISFIAQQADAYCKLGKYKLQQEQGPNNPFIYTNKERDQRHSVKMPRSICETSSTKNRDPK